LPPTWQHRQSGTRFIITAKRAKPIGLEARLRIHDFVIDECEVVPAPTKPERYRNQRMQVSSATAAGEFEHRPVW